MGKTALEILQSA